MGTESAAEEQQIMDTTGGLLAQFEKGKAG